MNRDEMIATYTMVDYNNCGDIKGQAPLRHEKWKIIGDGIRTILLQVYFTTVDTYDCYEMSFSQ